MLVVGSWFLSLFLPSLDIALQNQPYLTVAKFEGGCLLFCDGRSWSRTSPLVV